tara:strand:- start:3825 stop:4280 length:456 start_codon:yes stop_codon:yes gene_type:complete
MIAATHLHAIIIHFPIALLIVGFLSEIISFFIKKDFFKTAAFYLLILGALGTITAYITGGYAGEGIEEGPLLEPMNLHKQAAFLILWGSIITVLFKSAVFYFKFHKPWAKGIGFLLYMLLVIAVGRTGYLGGQLVFSHGAGVEIALPDFNN